MSESNRFEPGSPGGHKPRQSLAERLARATTNYDQAVEDFPAGCTVEVIQEGAATKGMRGTVLYVDKEGVQVNLDGAIVPYSPKEITKVGE